MNLYYDMQLALVLYQKWLPFCRRSPTEGGQGSSNVLMLAQLQS